MSCIRGVVDSSALLEIGQIRRAQYGMRLCRDAHAPLGELALPLRIDKHEPKLLF